jgi:hypothetical protein
MGDGWLKELLLLEVGNQSRVSGMAMKEKD